MTLPFPPGFDATQYAEGETFDIPVTVHLTPEGFEVEAVDGVLVEAEAPAEEAVETELDAAALDEAMGREALA